MNYLRDFPNQVPLTLVSQVGGTTGTTAGSSADLIQDDGLCLAIRIVGPVTGSTPLNTTKMQESTDGTTWTDIKKYSVGTATTGENVTFGTTAMTDGLVEAIAFNRTKRYVRPHSTITGTGTLLITQQIVVGEQLKVL